MILYYTNNRKDASFTRRVYDIHREQAARVGQRFRAVVAKQIGAGGLEGDIVVPEESGPKFSDMYRRILRGLESVPKTEIVYLCEDDVLYPDARFKPSRKIGRGPMYYNQRLVYLCYKGFFWCQRGTISLSQAHGTAQALRYNLELKQKECYYPDWDSRKINSCEPFPFPGNQYRAEILNCTVMSVDIRGVGNSTWGVWPQSVRYFQDCWGWPKAAEVWEKVKGGQQQRN
jgi:hypothetical protein